MKPYQFTLISQYKQSIINFNIYENISKNEGKSLTKCHRSQIYKSHKKEVDFASKIE